MPDRQVTITGVFIDSISPGVGKVTERFTKWLEELRKMPRAAQAAAVAGRALRVGFKAINSALDGFASLTKRTVSAIFSLRTALVGLVAAIAAGRIARSFLELADDLDKLAKTSVKLQLPTQDLSALRFVAEQSGIAFNELTVGLRSAQRRIALFNRDGSGPAVNALKRLNLELQDSEGRLRPLIDLLPEIGIQLGKIPDEAERIAVAFDLFGDSGAAFLQLFEEGPAAIAELAAEAKALGIVFTRDQLKPIEALGDAINSLNRAWYGLRAAALQAIAPFVTTVINSLTNLVIRIRTSIPNIGQTIAEAFTFGGADARGKLVKLGNDIFGLAVSITKQGVKLLFISLVVAINAAVAASTPSLVSAGNQVLYAITGGLAGDQGTSNRIAEVKTKIRELQTELERIAPTQVGGLPLLTGADSALFSENASEIAVLKNRLKSARDQLTAFEREQADAQRELANEVGAAFELIPTQIGESLQEARTELDQGLAELSKSFDAVAKKEGPAFDLEEEKRRARENAEAISRQLNALGEIRNKGSEEQQRNLNAEKQLLEEIARIRSGIDETSQVGAVNNRIKELEAERAKELITEREFIERRKALQLEIVDIQIAEQRRVRDEILKNLELTQQGDQNRLALLKSQADAESRINQLQQDRRGVELQAELDRVRGVDAVTKPVEQIEQLTSGPLSNFFTTIITGSATAQEAFQALMASMLQAVVNFISQKAVEGFFGLFTGETQNAIAGLFGATTATGPVTQLGQPFGGALSAGVVGTATAAEIGAGTATDAGSAAGIAAANAPLTAALGTLTAPATAIATAASTLITPIGGLATSAAGIITPLGGIVAATTPLAGLIGTLSTAITSLTAAVTANTAAATTNTAATTADAAIPFASGGLIPGPNVRRDIVPIRAMPGEFMMRREAVARYGIDFFQALNRMMLPRRSSGSISRVNLSGQYASGGVVNTPAGGGSIFGAPVAAYIVADDQQLDRLLNGGAGAFMRFIEDNRSGVNAALDRDYRAGSR